MVGSQTKKHQVEVLSKPTQHHGKGCGWDMHGTSPSLRPHWVCLHPVPVPSPGWWHSSQQARHGCAEAKGHFSELSAAAHLCISLITLRREKRMHRKQWALQVLPNQPLSSFPLKCSQILLQDARCHQGEEEEPLASGWPHGH